MGPIARSIAPRIFICLSSRIYRSIPSLLIPSPEGAWPRPGPGPARAPCRPARFQNHRCPAQRWRPRAQRSTAPPANGARGPASRGGGEPIAGRARGWRHFRCRGRAGPGREAQRGRGELRRRRGPGRSGIGAGAGARAGIGPG